IMLENMSARTAAASIALAESSRPECVFWTNAALRVNEYAEAKKPKNRQGIGPQKRKPFDDTNTGTGARSRADVPRDVGHAEVGQAPSRRLQPPARNGRDARTQRFHRDDEAAPRRRWFLLCSADRGGRRGARALVEATGATTRLGRPVACRAARQKRTPLRAGLRIRGFQLQQPCLRLVCPFCDRLRAGGAEGSPKREPRPSVRCGGTKGGVSGTLIERG